MAKKHETFTMTKDHLKLLKNMWVGWESSMAGAPRQLTLARPSTRLYEVGII
jgi:hypothetical protein